MTNKIAVQTNHTETRIEELGLYLTDNFNQLEAHTDNSYQTYTILTYKLLTTAKADTIVIGSSASHHMFKQ